LPQLPQFVLSVCRFEQCDCEPANPPSSPHSVSGAQLVPHTPFAHTCPAGHVIPHPPQFALSMSVWTHALAHFVVPPRHTIPHAPWEHT